MIKKLSILTRLFVQSGVELIQCWRNLQPSLQNSLLSLQANILGPFDESAQIPLRLNVLSNLKATRSGNEEGVLNSLNFGFLNSQRSGCDLLSLLLGLREKLSLVHSWNMYRVVIAYLLLNHDDLVWEIRRFYSTWQKCAAVWLNSQTGKGRITICLYWSSV